MEYKFPNWPIKPISATEGRCPCNAFGPQFDAFLLYPVRLCIATHNFWVGLSIVGLQNNPP